MTAGGLVACPSWGLTAICMIWDQNRAGFLDFGQYSTSTGTVIMSRILESGFSIRSPDPIWVEIRRIYEITMKIWVDISLMDYSTSWYFVAAGSPKLVCPRTYQ